MQIVVNVQSFLEPLPLTACTLYKKGVALKPPLSIADLAGAEVRVGDNVQETINTCNEIYRPAK